MLIIKWSHARLVLCHTQMFHKLYSRKIDLSKCVVGHTQMFHNLYCRKADLSKCVVGPHIRFHKLHNRKIESWDCVIDHTRMFQKLHYRTYQCFTSCTLKMLTSKTLCLAILNVSQVVQSKSWLVELKVWRASVPSQQRTDETLPKYADSPQEFCAMIFEKSAMALWRSNNACHAQSTAELLYAWLETLLDA